MPIARQNMKDWGAQCVIVVDGVRLPPNVMRSLKSVQVVHERGKATSLSMEFTDWDYEIQNKWIKPNATIYVTCGWRHELRTKGPFKITEYSPSYPDSQAPSLSIQGASAPATKMNLSYRTQSYNGKTAKEVFEEVANRYNLSLEWIVDEQDNIEFTNNFPLTQAAQTDKMLLARIASKMGGYIWGAEGGVLFVQPPEYATETIQMNYRIGDKTIMSFTPEIKVFTVGGKKGKKTVSNIDVFDGESDIFSQLTDIAREESGDGDDENQEDPTEDVGFIAEGKKLLNSLLPDMSKENDSPQTKERFGLPVAVPFVGLNVARGDVYKFTDVTAPKEKVEGNATDATAVTDEQSQRQLVKSSRKTVVAGGSLVPTFPSWAWTAREAVFLNGLSTLTSSRFEVAKATLTYDNSNGLQTVLELKSHMPSNTNKKVGEAVDLAENNARQVQNQRRENRVILDPNTGRIQRTVSPNENESKPDVEATKFYLNNQGTNTSRVRGR